MEAETQLSVPLGLGLWSIAEIPKIPESYSVWLRCLRDKLERNLEKMKEVYPGPRNTYGDRSFQYHITNVQPRKGTRIHWIWEIDCDHEILHVNSRPFFRLSNVPRDTAFLSSISLDNYGHRACSVHTPLEHQYLWKPKGIDQAPRNRNPLYDRLVKPNSIQNARALFGLPERKGTCEKTRLSLYQTLVGTALRTWTLAYEIPQLGMSPTAPTVPRDLQEFGKALLELALRPMLFEDGRTSVRGCIASEAGSCWLRDDTCFQFFTGLESCWEDAVVSLVEALRSRPSTPSPAYGIAFSFNHILILRMSSKGGAICICHTPPLPFLPSFFATSPSTPGISALMDLSYVLENDLIPGKSVVPLAHYLATVPTELWSRIASHLTNPADLRRLGALTCQARSAVNGLLKYPHIAGYRVTRPRADPVDTYWVSPRWCRAYENDYLPQDGLRSLYSGRFDVEYHKDIEGLVLDIGPGDPPLRVIPSMWSTRSTVPGQLEEAQIDVIKPGPSAMASSNVPSWGIKYRVIQKLPC
ncbi:hypothetical protein CC1G_00163 [Coprinopsis cinerea okayama7|uniref:F-box domain-containing protein n=1 Tax=Coprinopsis cinerea (strain Okayama-7 / 130 / ATCC MYA-4618 / FGSC 9003) TaxID=240176 RepID=A8NWZ8_COPC7|nr:hypothetical protein CC1G_00163 [Coprinopsis cinerea okayama7\|eukprot:XP_001837027.2 hypothetical protein CC1G_00163 [Coprinopsis cinerea okayama7\